MMGMLIDHREVKTDVKNDEGDYALHLFCQNFLNPSCKDLGQKLIDKGKNFYRKITKIRKITRNQRNSKRICGVVIFWMMKTYVEKFSIKTKIRK